MITFRSCIIVNVIASSILDSLSLSLSLVPQSSNLKLYSTWKHHTNLICSRKLIHWSQRFHCWFHSCDFLNTAVTLKYKGRPATCVNTAIVYIYKQGIKSERKIKETSCSSSTFIFNSAQSCQFTKTSERIFKAVDRLKWYKNLGNKDGIKELS